MATESWNKNLPGFYSDWAPDYTDRFYNELDYKPGDRELLKAFAASTQEGLICDLGCGPGHIGSFLMEAGRVFEGIDISPGMIEIAKKKHPSETFRVGSYFDLPVEDSRYAGVVAFYSLIHCQKERLVYALNEISRVLVTSGQILASFHEGTSSLTKDSVTFNFFTRAEIENSLHQAGFEVESIMSRASYPEEGSDWSRIYVTAVKKETIAAR